MTQFIMALAAALAILTTTGAVTSQSSTHPGTVVPAEVYLPDPF
jgi:hypothetical protein